MRPGWFWSLPLPFMGIQPEDHPNRPDSPIGGEPPEIVLASGRRTVPYLRVLQERRKGNGSTLIVFLKDPRLGRMAADFVWAPVHDRLGGDDVISTHTSPHGWTDGRLEAERHEAIERFGLQTGAVTGIVLGGNSGSVKWDASASAELARLVAALPDNDFLLVTPSRRTPPVLADAIREAVASHQHFFWNGQGENPYGQMLAFSDRLIVTGDSHNMVSEALVTGKPVHIFRPPGLQKKLRAFLDAMGAEGAIVPLTAPLSGHRGKRVDANDAIVAAIAERLGKDAD